MQYTYKDDCCGFVIVNKFDPHEFKGLIFDTADQAEAFLIEKYPDQDKAFYDRFCVSMC